MGGRWECVCVWGRGLSGWMYMGKCVRVHDGGLYSTASHDTTITGQCVSWISHSPLHVGLAGSRM